MKTKFPKITIVTPSYNQGKYIEQTICSVLDQKYKNIEYIIIDGGSTDNTISVIKKYEKYLAYWVSESDYGQAHAINKGLFQATGGIFNWLNSDDYYEKDALGVIVDIFLDNPKINVLCGYTHCFYDKSLKTSHTYRTAVKKNATDTLLNLIMGQPGTFYKMNIVRELGYLNESLRYVFDNELWMKYLCRYGQKNIKRTKKLIAHFRLHNSSKSIGEGYELFYKEHCLILHYLAKQTDIDKILLNLYEKEIKFNSKYQTELWNIDKLDIQKFHSWFKNKYLLSIFMLGNNNLAFKSAIDCFKTNQFEFNRKNISIFLKLIFLIARSKLLNRS